MLQQSSAIDKQLAETDATAQKYKDQVDAANANVAQAQKNLDDANKAMSDGTYRIGNDQFIDQDYIRNAQNMLNHAKQAAGVAQQQHNSYLQKHR